MEQAYFKIYVYQRVNLLSLLHLTSTTAGLRHPIGVQLCQLRLESENLR